MAVFPISLLINYILPSFILICIGNNFRSTNNEANGTQNTIKRKSVEADSDNEKKKATTGYQGLPMTQSGTSHSTKTIQNTKKRKSLEADRDNEKKKATTGYQGFPVTRSGTSHSTKTIQNTKKRKSLGADSDNEKKKTKKATTSYQGKPSKRFSCGICFDSVKESKIFTNTSCNHPFCTKCISKYVKLQRKQKVVKLTCPDPQCSLELKPQHLQSILPKELIVEWESAIYESSISLKKKIYCPYKNCSLMLVNDGKEVVTSCECPSCHRLFCAQCKVPWHADMSCRRFQKSAKRRDEKQLDEKFMELAKRNKWQKCPKCCMHVQRNGGCEHMSCRCGCNFCYKCGKDWKHGHICKTCRS
ncbi:uncharacterized protein LOC131630288 [Vicia villosa]|uniref:uncharacterized protein LOC131630288 n=1 Tax=Vicia villosa TaxID=3911 RepID=UPI00273AAE27|nr:uncharacterized protein LOC131630288 [Vicia villosa]